MRLLSGNSKISQLKVTESGYKNILRLYIPVNNIQLPDVNIPADLVQIFHHFKIFKGYNMGISAEMLHRIYFLNAVLHKVSKIFSSRLLIIHL